MAILTRTTCCLDSIMRRHPLRRVVAYIGSYRRAVESFARVRLHIESAAMTAVRMDGKELAAKVREGVARQVSDLGHVGLATVLVGDDPASHVYISSKHKAATEAGIDARDVRLPA